MRPMFCVRRKSGVSLSSEMSPGLIVIGGVSLQETAQVRFAEPDEVVATENPARGMILRHARWRLVTVSVTSNPTSSLLKT